MSSLIPRPGTSPSGPGPEIQTVHVRDLGTTGQPLKQGNDNNDVDLRELWQALVRRKKLVGVTAGSIIVLAALMTCYQRLFRPVYQGSFSLLITDPISSDGRAPSTATGASGAVFEDLALNTTRNDIPTLIEVLQSPLLLSPVAKQFGLTAGELNERISITTGGEKRNEAKGVLNVSLIGRKPNEDSKLLEAVSEVYLQAALQQRQQRLSDGLEFLNKQAPSLENKTSELQGKLASFRERHSQLEPSVEGGALKERQIALETVVMNIKSERNRLSRVRAEIAAGNLSARSFQEAVSTGSSNASSGQTQGLSVTDADQTLLQQTLKVESELAEARSKYQRNSAMVRSLESRLNQLQPLLRKNQLEAVDAALKLNAGRLDTANRQQEQLESRFLKQPALIQEYEALQQDLNIAKANLSGLVKAREKFQLEMAQRSVPWRVLSPPEINPEPIKPSVPRNMALGVLIGLISGAGAALLRERFDHVFRKPEEVKDDLGLPLLGHVPHVQFFEGVRENKRFLLEELDRSVSSDANTLETTDSESRRQQIYQRFFYQEAFRNLFTSIRFLNSDTPLKAIALTSSQPAEGKSLVNVLLAKTLAEMGQRILLVDADLRKPQMHSRLGLNNLMGLSNLLTGESNDWQKVVQKVDTYEGWSVITAGRRPPDPARLMSSKRMHQLVQDLKESGQFDLILFDTLPVLGLADAALVSEHCDGLMLLVSLGRVDRSLPKEAIARIRTSGVPLLGLITNSINSGMDGSEAYGYGNYGSAYQYGYSDSYAKFQTPATYAHYANDDDSSSRIAPQEANTTWKGKVRQRCGQMMRWLDGR